MDGTWDGLHRRLMKPKTMPRTTEYDMRWKSHRGFSMGVDYGVPVESWTAERVILPSLHQSTAVSMRLRIQGKRRAGKLRARRWFAEVVVGQSLVYGSLRPCQKTHACRSVADAERRADASLERGDFDEVIERTMREAYNPRTAESYFRWDEPSQRWVPFLTWFRISYMDPLHLPKCSYFTTRWMRPVDGYPYVTGREVRVDGMTAFSSGGRMQDGSAQEIGTWIPEGLDLF